MGGGGGVSYERKRTGTYYTPRVLVEQLIKTTLIPVIDRACAADDPEAAVSALTVCDPACGAGAFLVAALQHMARRLASIRADTAAEDIDHAAADLARQMYGVDLNPLAVDFTRLTVSAAAAAPGRPNPALADRIKCGNALIGATPKLLRDGLPDGAFTAVEGDDPKWVAALRKRNAREREQLRPGKGAA